jgi:hypothetical protein
MNTNIGWTAQSPHGYVHDEGMPGQTFTEDQMPHAELQRVNNINPELYRSAHGLWVEPAAGPMPEFYGTETGYAPADAVKKTGNVESFMSVPRDSSDAFRVSQLVGGSEQGLEYPRAATGHILDSLHEKQPHVKPEVVVENPVVDDSPIVSVTYNEE